mgnify:CR=1 FL=1
MHSESQTVLFISLFLLCLWSTSMSSEKRHREGDSIDAAADHNKRHHSSSSSSGGARWAVVNSESDSDSSHSSSDDSYERKRHKEKREKKHKKEKKSKHHKHKHKKEHKSSNSSRSSKRSAAVNQNEFGKYGIIRDEHFYQKQKEFEAYMNEVKRKPELLNGSKREIMDAFKGYIEDYNTATMPHEKYYSYDEWEIKQYALDKQQKGLNDQNSLDDGLLAYDGSRSSTVTLGDEEQKRKELLYMRNKQQQQEFEAMKNRMKSGVDSSASTIREDMRRQEQLQGQLSLAYKANDKETVNKLTKLLKPDDTMARLKHTEKLLGNKGGWK